MGSAVASKSEEKKTKTQSPAASESASLQLQQSAGATAGLPLFLQRSCSCGGGCAACQEQPVVHRKQSDGSPVEVSADVIPAASASAPLDRNLRQFLELRTGFALADVRIHTDAAAAGSAAALHADAYTVGRDIYFGAGKFDPATEAGKRLIAHEVAHTVQQSEGRAPNVPARRGTVLVGAVNDPAEHEADAVAEKVVNPAASASASVGTQHKPAVRRGIRSALAGAWDTAKAGVGAVADEARNIASDVWDAAKETAAAFIDRLAPGLLPFLRDIGGTLFEKITSGLGGVMGGLSRRIGNQGVTGAIAGLLGELAGTLGKALGQLVSGSCSSMVSAASSVIGFVKQIGGAAFAELGKAAKAVGAFFSEVWDDFGAPALEAIRKAAGAAWTWIEDKASWAWNKLLPIREASSAAWNWVKREFNLVMDEGAGLLDWIQEKAKKKWFEIRDRVAPILGPLKLVAAALVLLSPLGPILAIWKGGPALWSALQWIWANGLKPVGSAAVAWLREHILPHLLSAVSSVTGLLDQASAFLCGHAASISAGLTSLQGALSNIPFMSPAAAAVGLASSFFGSLAGKAGCKFSDVIASAKAVLRTVYNAAKPVLELLREAVLIATFGPWAILDDGVWARINSFVAFAQRTPCIREIAGLLHVSGAMQVIGRVRAYLKDIWKVISNQDQFEAAIHKALDGMVAKIPGQVTRMAGTVSGLDGPHVTRLLNSFLIPKLAKVAGHWKDMLIDMVKDIVWPWPGVMKDVDATEKDIAELKTALWDFDFSKAADAGLGIWRDVNGIIGHLYGWFFIASVLIGAIFASPQAGAAVAAEVGEVLLVSTIAAEVLTIAKSRMNLMSSTRLALSGKTREDLDKTDYENMAGSIVNLGVLEVMSILGELAADFAKAVFAEIKGIFLPEGEKAPSVETTSAPETAAEPAELPAEQLETERAEIKQRIADPENVKVPSEGGFDAEVEIDEHTYDRSEEDGTWCRHSTVECGIDLGDDVNKDIDDALDREEELEREHGDERPRRERISDGNKMELEDSGWLKKREPTPEARRNFMEWLKRNHLIGEEHAHLRPGSREAQVALDRWRAEEGRVPAAPADAPVPAANVPPEVAPVQPEVPPAQPAEVPKPADVVDPPAPQTGEPASCFPAGTLVSTPGGLRAIETLCIGDEVLSFCPATNQITANRVVDTLSRTVAEVLDLTIAGITVTCTAEHPWWVADAGWRSAGELTDQTVLLSRTRGGLKLESVTRRSGSFEVFNLTVDTSHTFLVSAAEFLVHNKAMARTPLDERVNSLQHDAFDAAQAADTLSPEIPNREALIERTRVLREKLYKLRQEIRSATPQEREFILEPEHSQLETDLVNLQEEIAAAPAEAERVRAEARRVELQDRLSDLQQREAELRDAAEGPAERAARAREKADRLTAEISDKRGPERDAAIRRAENARRQADALEKISGRSQAELADVEADIRRTKLSLSPEQQSALPCFAAGTPVWTDAGPRPIERILAGDIVLTFDFENNRPSRQPVLDVCHGRTHCFYDISIEGEIITATRLHRFWVEADSSWVCAEDLKPGTMVRLLSGRLARIHSVLIRQVAGDATFNLHVAEHSNYFVGPGALVHNQTPVAYEFGHLRIYAGTNPKYPNQIYIGQTDDIAGRQGQHRAAAEKALRDPNLSAEDRNFYEFMKEVNLTQRVSGLDPDQASYLEQRNIDFERGVRGETGSRIGRGDQVMNRRDQISPDRMPEMEAQIKADPRVVEAGFC